MGAYALCARQMLFTCLHLLPPRPPSLAPRLPPITCGEKGFLCCVPDLLLLKRVYRLFLLLAFVSSTV